MMQDGLMKIPRVALKFTAWACVIGLAVASLTPGQSNRRHHRQPEREKRRKRGACIDPHGYDAGKKIKGKKRHILVDTLGLLLHAIVHSADIQDRDGGILLLATLYGMHPLLRKLFADAGYQGPKFQKALAKTLPNLEADIVRRSDHVKGFAVLPKQLDRRAHNCLAQSLQAARQGLGEPQSQRPRVLAPCLNPPHAPKTLQSSLMFPDRLLEPGGERGTDPVSSSTRTVAGA